MKKMMLNPSCSTTIQRLEITDEEKRWVESKIKEYHLDKEVIECFITMAEKKSKKIDTGKWMSEEYSETWRDFNTLQTLLLVKRGELGIAESKKKLSKKELLKKEIEEEEMVITSLTGAEHPFSNDKIWKELYEHLDKYFKLKEKAKEAKKCN